MADLLNTGITGLSAAKKGLQTTGHNISNANTEGYSRQRVNQVTNFPVIKDGLITGTGTRVRSVNRMHDAFLERRLNQDISKKEFFEERTSQLQQLEQIFNEIDSEGLNKVLNRFFNSFRELAAQPENETIRSVVRDNASLVVKDFHRIRETMDSTAYNIDKKVRADITTINQYIKDISKLNTNIAILEAANDETGDLRDQRDLAIRHLSEHFDVNSYTDNRNNFIVNAKGVGTLVSAGEHQELVIGTRGRGESSNNMAGSVEVFFKSRPQTAITDRFTGGSLSSCINVRNVDLQKYQSKMDEIALEFSHTVNAIHRRGFVNRPIEMDESGAIITDESKGPITGIDFFKIPDDSYHAAAKIDLSDAVKADLNNIATALAPNSPGDNRIALGISKIQHERLADEGTVTLEEKFLKTIGNIGLETGKATLNKDQTTGILAQTTALKERVSGVSLDEEAANMVRYQHAFDASARVMRTADEMFKTVLGILP